MTPSAGGLGQSGQPVPVARFLAWQRDLPIFSGTDGTDIEDCLTQVDRVAAHNKWDDGMRLANVFFFVTSTVLLWFGNNETALQTWVVFKAGLSTALSKSTEGKQDADRKLSARHQGCQETFTLCLEDALPLCCQVDAQVSYPGELQHLLDSLSERLDSDPAQSGLQET